MEHWEHHEIHSMTDIEVMRQAFLSDGPTLGAFDTETWGLDIIDDRPFLFQFGWPGKTWVMDIEESPAIAQMAVAMWHSLVPSLKWYVGANVKYDMHMTTNWNPRLLYTGTNLTELQAWIRMAHDNVTAAKGGVPLGLKDYATLYIDRHAKNHEKLLKVEQGHIAKELNLQLQQAMKDAGPPPPEWGFKSWTIGCIEWFFKDILRDPEDLPSKAHTIAYYKWKDSLHPRLRQNVQGRVISDDVPYGLLNRKNLIRYGHMDIVYTLEILKKCMATVEARDNMTGIYLENDCIIPFFEMERVGFDLDIPYIRASKVRMKHYMQERRQRLYELAGEDITCGQHAKIKEIINRTTRCTATGSEELGLLVSQLMQNDPENPAIEFIGLVQELRTLEKWYATYLLRFARNPKPRAHTQINQVGTVSGRVTSDFQQFPKEAILDAEGNELFHPRRMVKTETPIYPELVYLDWSQIELRVQAFYTYLLGAPDLNLCRAYMPHQCYSAIDGIEFDGSKPDIKVTWDQDIWLQVEDDKPWVATDVHSATTKIAFDMDESHPDFKHNRYMGKRVNFAKNYGATFVRIRSMFPHLPETVIHRIDESYYIAFPGVRKYHDYCEQIAAQASVRNLFGVRYYNVSGHNLKNMLVQGSSAYLLKKKIVEIWRYMRDNNVKSKMQMNIHDEISFKRHKDDPVSVFFDIKQIMETWDDCVVPIVSEMEVTSTTWAEKKKPSPSWR